MIRGAIFDLDGTLCDTAPDIFGCWLAALKAAGLETERFRRDFRIGPPLEPMIAGLFPELTEPEREALIASFRELYCTSGFPGTVPYPGIPALLERLQAYRIGLTVNAGGQLQPEKSVTALCGLRSGEEEQP